MGKRMAVWCIAFAAVFLLASCGTAGKRIMLPEARAVKRVTVSGGAAVRETDNEGDIAQLIRKMGLARGTGKRSIQDRPLANDVLQVNFEFRHGGVSTLFLYREGEKVLLEQPYQGIYQTDRDILNFLWE